MLLLVLCAVCVQTLVIIGGGILAAVWIRREKRALQTRLEEWFIPPAEGQSSRISQAIEAAAALIGSAAARSIMATLRADKSHVQRVVNNLTEEGEASANPLMAMLTAGGKGKGSSLGKLASMLAPMLAGMVGGGNGATTASSVQNRLQKGQG